MSDPDPLMPIGQFSRASLVSVKALRSYHAQGLLVPDSVDSTTGYRSYRVSQLTDAQIIRRLRDLDVPLAAVAEVMTARDPDVTRKVIAEHESAMRARLADVARIVDELQHAADLPSLHTPVHVRVESPTHVVTVTGEIRRSDYAEFLGDAFSRLWETIGRLGVPLAGPSGALYPPEVSEDETVVAYLPIAAPVALPDEIVQLGVELDLLPEAAVAVATHSGSFLTIGDTYRRLGAWVAGNADSIDRPVREHYVVSVDESTGELLPDDQLRTEILWPIRQQGATT